MSQQTDDKDIQVSVKVDELKPIPEDVKKRCLQSTMFHFLQSNPFLGNMVNEMMLRYTTQIPTAAIWYNKKADQFEIGFNPYYFCEKPIDERIGIVHHEILHFVHKHLFRNNFVGLSEDERRLWNIAADMAINQYIPMLPKGCVNVNDWKLDNGQPFPKFKTMEEYHDLLKDNQQQNKAIGEKYGEGGGLDEHNWEELSEEEKQKLLAEAKKVIKRTIEKTQYGHSTVPDFVNELIESIEVQLAKLNYKGILKSIIKRTVSSTDRESSWKRRNKRYGTYAPGTTLGKLPALCMLGDTSGSISWVEFNQFLRIIDNFLKVGVRNCMLGFWHTDLYGVRKYKLGQSIQQADLQSGGTDVTAALEYVKKKSPDLSIILTDGYFDLPDVKVKSQIVWIISENGNSDKNFLDRLPGKVINLSNLK